jgi:hypothetical protein
MDENSLNSWVLGCEPCFVANWLAHTICGQKLINSKVASEDLKHWITGLNNERLRFLGRFAGSAKVWATFESLLNWSEMKVSRALKKWSIQRFRLSSQNHVIGCLNSNTTYTYLIWIVFRWQSSLISVLSRDALSVSFLGSHNRGSIFPQTRWGRIQWNEHRPIGDQLLTGQRMKSKDPFRSEFLNVRITIEISLHFASLQNDEFSNLWRFSIHGSQFWISPVHYSQCWMDDCRSSQIPSADVYNSRPRPHVVHSRDRSSPIALRTTTVLNASYTFLSLGLGSSQRLLPVTVGCSEPRRELNVVLSRISSVTDCLSRFVVSARVRSWRTATDEQFGIGNRAEK